MGFSLLGCHAIAPSLPSPNQNRDLAWLPGAPTPGPGSAILCSAPDLIPSAPEEEEEEEKRGEKKGKRDTPCI